MFASDRTELGLTTAVIFADTGDGVSERMFDVTPFLRARWPLRDDAGEWGELYVLGGAGLTVVNSEASVPGGSIVETGFGWNAGYAAGGQLRVADDLALFADVGSRLHGVAHSLVEVDGVEVDDGKYRRDWSEITFAVGLAFLP